MRVFRKFLEKPFGFDLNKPRERFLFTFLLLGIVVTAAAFWLQITNSNKFVTPVISGSTAKVDNMTCTAIDSIAVEGAFVKAFKCPNSKLLVYYENDIIGTEGKAVLMPASHWKKIRPKLEARLTKITEGNEVSNEVVDILKYSGFYARGRTHSEFLKMFYVLMLFITLTAILFDYLFLMPRLKEYKIIIDKDGLKPEEIFSRFPDAHILIQRNPDNPNQISIIKNTDNRDAKGIDLSRLKEKYPVAFLNEAGVMAVLDMPLEEVDDKTTKDIIETVAGE